MTALEQDTGTSIVSDDSLMKDGFLPVTIRGQTENCLVAKETIERHIVNRSEITVWVPEEKTGSIVGTGGEIQKALERDTGTMIYHDVDSVQDGLVPIIVIGQHDQCTAAKETIEQLITNDSKITIWVPEEMIGGIAGSRAVIPKTLEHDTGTLIFSDRNSIKNGHIPVIIKGRPDQCTAAKETIEELVANFSEITIWVPEAKASSVIGRKGAKIIALQQITGTIILFKDDLRKDGLIPAIIQGQPKNCMAAKEGIQQLLIDHPETTIWVPETKIGLLLVMRGAVLKWLEKETGANISPNRDLMEDGLVPIAIKVQPGQRDAAITAIKQRLQV